MSSTFYLKYRPQKIAELDLTEVREQLQKIVKSGKIPHAFLLAGPRGAGKTSAARILAKIVNCENPPAGGSTEPCNKCDQCVAINKGTSLDIIEIDAASHGLVEDARAIREAAKLSTAGAKKKVYIIDEAHMLTPAASNALLKTLEEPPEHVMFILATTAPEKLLDTIRSRCTILNFRKATPEEVLHALQRAADGEKLKVEDGVLEGIAGSVDGSFREAHKLLEQLSLAGGKISLDESRRLIGLSTLNPDQLLSLLTTKNTKKALEEIERVVQKGVNLKVYTSELVGSLRKMLLAKIEAGEKDTQDTRKLIELFSEAARQLPTAVIPQLPLELAVVRFCEEEKLEVRNGKIENEVRSKKEKSNLDEQWKEVMRRVKPRNHSIEALLRATRLAEFDGKTLRVEVFYEFHKDRLEKDTYRRIVEEVAGEVLGVPVRIVCVLSSQKQRAADIANVDEEVEEDIVKAAEEIFGAQDDENVN